MYNTFGKGAWPELKHCANLVSALGAPPPKKGPDVVSPSTTSKLFHRIDDLYSSLDPDSPASPDPRRELYALVEVQLGSDYDRRKIEAVAIVQQRLQTQQGELAAKLQNREMTPARYFDLVTGLQYEAAQQTESILGRVDFEKLFGVSAAEAPTLAEKETFLAQYR
jgi:hypothetical protein